MFRPFRSALVPLLMTLTAVSATLLVVADPAGSQESGLAASPAPPAAMPRATADPVVSVHGYTVDGSMRFFFRSMRAAGYPSERLFGFDFDGRIGHSPSNRVHARALRDYLRDVVLPATGAEQVDIVAHSMGSLVSRWCIRFVAGCGEMVDDWISVGGPNHGTIYAFACNLPIDPACAEMRAGSRFLERLNRGDETPGAVEYTTIRSRADWIVIPTSSVVLTGARNILVRGYGHMKLIKDPRAHPSVRPAVRDHVLAALD